MRIKYINWITGIVVLLQTLASWTVFISPDFTSQMAAQMMDKEISGDDAFLILKTFMSVFGYFGLGVFVLIMGINTIKDLETAQKMCLYLGIFMLFFSLPDIVHMVTGTLPHQPIIAILINLSVTGLLLYGWEKGTV
tara:strand:+ start:135 stop:545 length:411 start_codon:yes stop_codon:yes gene_type:complete